MHYDVLPKLQISNWLLYIETLILGTSMEYIQQYDYVSILIALNTNLRCLFLISLIAIPYMTCNMWIKHSRYVFTIYNCPPLKISFLIWTHKKNREQYIDHRNYNSWFISCVSTNTFLGNLICTYREYVLGHTYIGIITLWYKLSLLVYLHTI